MRKALWTTLGLSRISNMRYRAGEGGWGQGFFEGGWIPCQGERMGLGVEVGLDWCEGRK